ncbi:GNAT family N-acetyltransferase [Xylanimonas allomyrinae]|uniref:GNAT family N-acetyltransferase n=1 Tax=Xylanimonas allomyrinae TaxID=2509459 RepID=UPI0026820EAA
MRSLVTESRSYVRLAVRTGDPYARPTGPMVEFKAELGAIAQGVAQVQGVWVDPAVRGRGLSEGGMAAVVVDARLRVAPVVSLYVNGYNERALRAYRRVGFEQVGTFATVLF